MSSKMAGLRLPMIPTDSLPSDSLPSGEDLLALERQCRRSGSGITVASLIGTWRLRATWSRDGTPAPAASAALLRGLGACLILSGEETDGALQIVNQVNLGSLRLRFDGEAELTGRRPLLMFSFRSVRLSLGKLTLFERSLPQPDARRMPYFALIGLDREQGRLSARGRGGGLALWMR
ncbi:putative conserved membrane protein [Synechococcus sp. A15-127]|nr:putative conserved membrane protein [Synechococcus sp. A15-127]